MANSTKRCVTRDCTKITPDQITIAGSVTRQQHKISQCVVAKIQAKFNTADGHSSWENFENTFTEYKTERNVEKGLKAHDFVLERIIPNISREPILEFRVRSEDQLYTLKEKVDNGYLANIILDYMIHEEDRQHTHVLVLTFDQSQSDELEKKLQLIKWNSDVNYEIYEKTKRVDDLALSKKTEVVSLNKENAPREMFVKPGLQKVTKQRHVLQNIPNGQ